MIDAFRLLPDGTVIGLYTDAIDLRRLGHVQAERASWVEWDEVAQAWVASLIETGESLGPFRTRTDAVAAERHTLARRLASAAPPAPAPTPGAWRLWL